MRGLNFYVWDEDSREAADWALELARSSGETAPQPWYSAIDE